MSPSDKNKTSESTISKEGGSQECPKPEIMDSSSELASSSVSDVTIPGHGMIANIPLITASLPTSKCSVNDQMKTFDPGEDGGTERLTSNQSGNVTLQGKSRNSGSSSSSSSSLIKSSGKNYIAGSKINKLADMLAKRSQNVVEVTQNSTSDIITDITSAPKVEETVILNNVSNIINFEKNFNSSIACFEKTANNKELDLFRKSRRKSVPNQSCNVNRLQLQSTSKSCSDFSKLFPNEKNSKPDFNALGGSLNKLQTDESTKKKAVRKNLKNVELPLILPKRKRRSMRNENLVNNKVIEKILDSSAEPIEETNKSRENRLTTSIPAPVVSVNSTKKISKVKQKKSKKLVETSTQTTDIEFITVLKPKPDVVEKPVAEGNEKPSLVYECLYCTQTFALGSQCKAHEKTHTQKNKQLIKCQYCSKKLPSLDELKSHCVQKHPNKYAYCMKCDERFSAKEELYSHNKEIHLNKNVDTLSQNVNEEEIQEKLKTDTEERQTEKKITKQNGVKDLKIDVSYDSSKKSSVSPRNVQKVSPKETKTEEQLLEMEMLFYSNLSGNIQENLTNHLDGKMDKSGIPVRTDQIKEPVDSFQAKAKSSNSLSVDTPSIGVPEVQMTRAPSPYQTRSKTPNPLPPTAKKFKKLPNWQQKFWEKYNFPTNYRYEHRFWDKNYLNTEKSAFYLKDLSCLDIKTQLTMRENIKKLDDIKLAEEISKSGDKLKFPDYLSLVPRSKSSAQDNERDLLKSSPDLSKNKKVFRKEEAKKSFKSPGSELPVVKTRRKLSADNTSAKKQDKNSSEGLKMMTRRQSSIDLPREDKEDDGKKKEGNLKSCQRMCLRRQTSLDSFQEVKTEKIDQILECNVNNISEESTPLSPTGYAEISGEWVRPRSYLCGTCCAKFTNLWELEDHKWVSHPNVWCTHYEFEDEKIDKLFQKNEDEEGNTSESSALSKSKLTDLYKRYLLPHGSLKTAKLVPNSSFPEQCTKCKKNCMNSSEMHKHMLDCGGDTTWFLTMYSSPMTIKRKWRPFGSRRRKQIGRRDLKRNIPSTPTLRSYHYQHRVRTKPGDVESIQKMLANLPEKRARRAINFDEIKTRSQATIHSNRLLRKRFKSTFTNNFLKLKNLKQKRQLKPPKKGESSRSATDTSSENTPMGSPKRKNKLKECSPLLKGVNSKEESIESPGDTETKSAKKKSKNKKKETEPKIKSEKVKVKKAKPIPKTEGFVAPVNIFKPRKKAAVIKVEVSESETHSLNQPKNKVQISISKSAKKSKKKIKKANVTPIKVEVVEEPEVVVEMNQDVTETPKAAPKKIKLEVTSPVESPVKNKSQPIKIPSVSILRLKQSSKDSAELLKLIKKKYKNSKKISEPKEIKRADEGSRRSLRLKSLQRTDESQEDPTCQPTVESNENENDFQKDTQQKKSIRTQNLIIKKLIKTPNSKSLKTDDHKDEKEMKIIESPSRRSLRTSRNSFEEKPEMLTQDSCSDSPKVSNSRRNSKTFSDTTETTMTEVVEDLETIEKSGLQIVRSSRNVETKSESALVNGQISLLKKSRLPNPRILRGTVKSEEVLETPMIDLSSNNDLAEMPILAKVEPIRGKISGKNEKEIPILSPVEKEQVKEFEEEIQSTSEDLVSFQVIKKPKKTSKEVTPLKIVKKIESTAVENIVLQNSIPVKVLGSSLNGTSEIGKTKKKKFHVAPAVEISAKKSKTDVKKYFLGICPSEIDKGRKELFKEDERKDLLEGDERKNLPDENVKKDLPDESGSDSEPLISLVVSQPQKGNKDEETSKEEKKTVEVEVEVQKVVPIKLKEKRKSSKKIKKKKNVVQKLKSIAHKSVDSLLKLNVLDKKVNETQSRIEVDKSSFAETINLNQKIKIKNKKKKKSPQKITSRLLMTVTLKEPTLKIIEKPNCPPTENKWTVKALEPKIEIEPLPVLPINRDNSQNVVNKDTIVPERRSRRISKETKQSSEFIIDDPLILVDELWSDLDSDSDSSKKKTKKGKKKFPKKKSSEDKKISDVNLEELLRNFGENKETNANKCEQISSVGINVIKKPICWDHARKMVEKTKDLTSYKRLSLKLFRFNKSKGKFGYLGVKLAKAKKDLKQRQEKIQVKDDRMPDLPFLAAEIKENPVQVIKCGAQKPKTPKRSHKKADPKVHNSNIHLKISLPLETINNMAVFNNNNLTELVVEEVSNRIETHQEVSQSKIEKEKTSQEELPVREVQASQDESLVPTEVVETSEMKNKSKRSEVIDKIFSCEICQTYYYSSSQLKIHKLSNRHKLKELELQQATTEVAAVETEVVAPVNDPPADPIPLFDKVYIEASDLEIIEAERLNEDTLEMPTLEGPFIENAPSRIGVEPIEPVPQPPEANSFGFSQESLKDIQRAIGCTDEEMLILTLLGDSTLKLENDILDLDSCKSVETVSEEPPIEKVDVSGKEVEKTNGTLKPDLKQRMTSALACLVNKAVFNLLQKYQNATKSTVNSEALSLLKKLLSLNRRKNILQLNELLKKQTDAEGSLGPLSKDGDKKEPAVSYKYQCTICGSRFEKASTRECHISRSHKGKAKKLAEDAQIFQTPLEEDWNDTWTYDPGDDHQTTNPSQFWCSDCGINFISPQEVLDHQKSEHQAGPKNSESGKDAGPLQSSTIGSSDEIIEGKKTRRRPKIFSSEELDQQRIIANNELRKLDRKFSSKNKANKIKWGMDALKFTVEKENKVVSVEEEKEIVEDGDNSSVDLKNIDLVPKLNLSRTSNIPEFKVIQKHSLKNRFQKIMDNKLKRKSSNQQQDPEMDDVETELMLVPVVVKKKSKKQRPNEYETKKGQEERPLDIYDFNESESDGEPVVLSHVKKPSSCSTRLKLVKVKEGPSKNKADSTTKDLSPEDYDSEDSLPLSVVKKSKPGEEDDEKVSEGGTEKKEGILEQVEYLIEQLENETGPTNKKDDLKEEEKEIVRSTNKVVEYTKDDTLKDDSVDFSRESCSNRASGLGLENFPLKANEESLDMSLENERIEEPIEQSESILAGPESSQSAFDEEDSMPLVLMAKKTDESKSNQDEKKCDENTTDLSTVASEDAQLFRSEELKADDTRSFSDIAAVADESLPPVFSLSENEGDFSEKSEKPYENLNGNVIYCRNDSISDFGSDSSNDGLIDSNFDKINTKENDKNCIKEVTEKEDVVIVCSKGEEDDESNDSHFRRKGLKSNQRRKKENLEFFQKKKKRFPLLTATIEENNFRKSESPKLNKEVIVRKIWSRRKLAEDSTDNDEDSLTSLGRENSIDHIRNDESQTEIEKEIIVKKIWSRKKVDHEDEFAEKTEEMFGDVKINQTEISDEVVIKCGPKAKGSPKRRKSKTSTNEASKETIMRKIWSGKCTFQTKAALKTYDSDVMPNCKENDTSEGQAKSKKRGRPSAFASAKRNKTSSEVEKDDEDDLDSLLEEIEREQLEKAIRLEFLQLRRSEKGSVEILKEGSNPTIGLFTETSLKHKKEVSERKRRKVKKKISHPRQSVLKRKKFLKKPIRRVRPSEERNLNNGNKANSELILEQTENSIEKNIQSFDGDSKIKIRKHKKHRHKHHHHKHKHKKSKHHKCIVSKHKTKHKSDSADVVTETTDSFTILEKICQDIPNQIEIENEINFQSRPSKKREDPDLQNVLSPFPYENNPKDCDVGFEDGLSGKSRFESGNGNIYEFVEDLQDFSPDGLRSLKM